MRAERRAVGISTALPALAAVLLSLLMASKALAADPSPRGIDRVEGSYIVLLHDSVKDVADTTESLERGKGFKAGLLYRRAVRGFSAKLNDSQVARLRDDATVASVTPDRPVKALGEVDLAGGDSVPAGVRRLGAAAALKAREASTANLAVLDSGIDLSHPDLNAADGVNCVAPGTPAQDDDGHGTHVAGTIGARNNGRGVVGVVPGTKTYSVKVLGPDGNGTTSQLLCGIDWVTASRTDADPSNDIGVANLSLGGEGGPVRTCARTADPLHRAICASTSAGVTYVVAAGNDGRNFDNPNTPDLPAAYPEVLTVAAMSDSDGAPGGTGGAPSCRPGEGDDRYASFSNYAATSAGAAHTVAGPGVCVRSTYPGGGYASLSGTSMAAPHLAGAVASCLGEGGQPGPCAGLSPAAIVAKVREVASSRLLENPGAGFIGDPVCAVSGRFFGHLAWSGSSGAGAAGVSGSSICGSTSAPTDGTTTSPPPAQTPAPSPVQTPASMPIPPAHPVDRMPPRATISVSRQRLARVLRSGLRLGIRCSERCLATAEVWLPGRTAKRVRLSRGTTARIARRSALRLATGVRKSVALKLSRAARHALARGKRVTLRVDLTVRDAAGNRRKVSRHVTVRR